MKLTAKQRKTIKENGHITFYDENQMNELSVCYGEHNAWEHKSVCNWKYDGWSHNFNSLVLNGKVVLISKTLKKVEVFIDTIDYLNFDFSTFSKEDYFKNQ